MKTIRAIYTPPHGHWVGDGFPVRTLISYDRLGADAISPFLLLDYAGPADFSPAQRPRGVGSHPHRGFETVTLVYRGELEHRDSTGSGGRIGEGDVQWMTAGAGIVHEEFHSEAFTRNGGTLEMVQLWVNLPAAHKGEAAAYQTILDGDIPRVALHGTASDLRVIAGDYQGHVGPAHTYTPINLWDLTLEPGTEISLSTPANHNTLLVVREGLLSVNGNESLGDAQCAAFDQSGDEFTLKASERSSVLILSGEPINEPLAGMGPFVMNTQGEIEQAVRDFRSGRFGKL